jgi:hypothetical protein
MANSIFTIGGVPFFGPFGQVYQTNVPAAPNGVTIGEITIEVDEDIGRTFSVTLASSVSSGIIELWLNIYGTLGGIKRSVAWQVPPALLTTMKASTGAIVLGTDADLLPDAPGMQIEFFRWVPEDADGAGACDPVFGGETVPSDVLPVWTLPQPATLTEGDAFSVDWHDYCPLGASFVVTNGLTGGISSGTGNRDYDVASLDVEDPTPFPLTVEATSSSGHTSIGIWPITVEALVLNPALVSPIVDQTVVNDDSLAIRLSDRFSGTDLVFSLEPADDVDFGLGTGADADLFHNKRTLTTARGPLEFTVTATNSGGSASDTFNVTVSVVRADAPVWGTDVIMGAAEATYTDWRTGTVEWASPGGTPLWTRSVPDANSTVPAEQFEEFESLGGGDYRMRMTDATKRGNPDTQTATITLGTDPITTVNGSNLITIAKTAHGLGVGRKVTIANAPTLNGLTAAQINGTRAIVSKTTNAYVVQAGGNATSGSAGGGTGITYTANRADYSVMAPGETADIRVAVRDGSGVVSRWSAPMQVPQVVTLGGRFWRFNSRRPQGAYTASPPWVGALGNQYQHVVAWNKGGTRDTSKRYYLFTGQDENSVSFSPDGGRTFSPIVGFGKWSASENGLYYNSDDLTNGLLLSMGGSAYLRGKCGLYASTDDARTFRRINLKRTGGADPFASNYTYFPRVNMNLIDRRPQNAAGTLTDAQRPIYAVAQQKNSAAVFTGCYLFKWAGGDILDEDNWSQVYEWATGDFDGATSTIDSEQGMTWVRVAANGDVIVAGRRGLWLSTNGGTAFTKKSSVSVRGIAVDTKTTGVSGVTIGISDKAGANDLCVLKTANIRDTAFSAPTNTGLPTNATIVSLQGADANWNRLYIVYKSGSSYVAKLSTNGGTSWQAINSASPPGYAGADAWRYGWGGGRGPGIYPHPTDANHVFAMVFVTGSVSLDGGANFDGKRTAFLDHAHTKGWGYDRTDWKHMVSMLQDSGAFEFPAGVSYYKELGLKYNSAAKNQAGTNGTPVSFAATVASNSSPVTRTQGRGAVTLHGSAMTLFTLSSDNVNNKCVPCIFAANGDIVVRTDVGWSRCAKFFHHPTDTGKIILGKWFISGWGTTPGSVNFTDYSDREVLGYSLVSGSPKWYFGAAGSSGTTIYRSANADGSGGTLWKTLGSTFEPSCTAVDFFNDGTVFVARQDSGTGGKAGTIERHTSGTSTTIFNATTTVAAAYSALGISTTGIPFGDIAYLLTDPNQEGRLVAVLDTPGCPIFFETANANAATPTWTNETKNLPHTYGWYTMLHPVTGELVTNSSMGEFWMPAPSSYPALTNLNYFTEWMDNFYGRADVPDQPVLPGV